MTEEDGKGREWESGKGTLPYLAPAGRHVYSTHGIHKRLKALAGRYVRVKRDRFIAENAEGAIRESTRMKRQFNAQGQSGKDADFADESRRSPC